MKDCCTWLFRYLEILRPPVLNLIRRTQGLLRSFFLNIVFGSCYFQGTFLNAFGNIVQLQRQTAFQNFSMQSICDKTHPRRSRDLTFLIPESGSRCRMSVSRNVVRMTTRDRVLMLCGQKLPATTTATTSTHPGASLRVFSFIVPDRNPISAGPDHFILADVMEALRV